MLKNHLLSFLSAKCLAALILLGAVVVIYAPVGNYDFVSYDDSLHLQENPAVADFNLENLKKIWSEPYFGLYIPVPYTLWGLEYSLAQRLSPNPLSQPSPAVFHTANLIVHALCTLLVFFFFLQLEAGALAAFLGSLIFSLHPLQAESVAWISSFRDLVAGFWSLVFMNLLLVSRRRGKTSWGILIALLVFLALALLSKPSAVVLISFAPLLLWWDHKKPNLQDIVIFFVGSGLALAILWITKSVQPDSLVDFVPSLWQRSLLALQALAFYGSKIFWPVHLTPDYGLNPTYLLQTWQRDGLPILSFLGVGVLLGFTLWGLWKKRKWSWGLVLALLFLAPYSGLIPFSFQNVSLVADRYCYLALVGASFSLVFLLAPFKKIGLAVLAVLSIGMIFLCREQIRIWADDRSIYPHMLRENDRSFYAYNGLGNIAFHQGHYAEALPFLKKAVELRPSYPQARHSLSRTFEILGNVEEAAKNYAELINLDPVFIEAYRDLAGMQIDHGLLAEAGETLRHGLIVAPRAPDLIATEGDLAHAKGDDAEAIAKYAQVIALEPRHYYAHRALGLLLEAEGKHVEAKVQITQCFQIDPERARREGLEKILSP